MSESTDQPPAATPAGTTTDPAVTSPGAYAAPAGPGGPYAAPPAGSGATAAPPRPPRTPGFDDVWDTARRTGVRRPRDDRWVGGVCSGLARRLGIDPVLVRVLLVATVLLGGIGLVAYALALVLLPDHDGSIELERASHGELTGTTVGAVALLLAGVVAPSPWELVTRPRPGRRRGAARGAGGRHGAARRPGPAAPAAGRRRAQRRPHGRRRGPPVPLPGPPATAPRGRRRGPPHRDRGHLGARDPLGRDLDLGPGRPRPRVRPAPGAPASAPGPAGPSRPRSGAVRRGERPGPGGRGRGLAGRDHRRPRRPPAGARGLAALVVLGLALVGLGIAGRRDGGVGFTTFLVLVAVLAVLLVPSWRTAQLAGDRTWTPASTAEAGRGGSLGLGRRHPRPHRPGRPARRCRGRACPSGSASARSPCWSRTAWTSASTPAPSSASTTVDGGEEIDGIGFERRLRGRPRPAGRGGRPRPGRHRQRGPGRCPVSADRTDTPPRTRTSPGGRHDRGPDHRRAPHRPRVRAQPPPSPPTDLAPPTGPAFGTLVWGCVALAVAALLGAWEVGRVRVDLGLVLPGRHGRAGAALVLGALVTLLPPARPAAVDAVPGWPPCAQGWSGPGTGRPRCTPRASPPSTGWSCPPCGAATRPRPRRSPPATAPPPTPTRTRCSPPWTPSPSRSRRTCRPRSRCGPPAPAATSCWRSRSR